jgi:hypothetical protein
LKAYSLYDPYLGYTQGINYIAGYLLTEFESEEAAFCMLLKLFERYELRQVFMPGFPALLEKTFIFDNCVRKQQNKLYSVLVSCDSVCVNNNHSLIME